MKLSVLIVAILCCVTALAEEPVPVPTPVPADAEIQRILIERLGDRADRVAIVVGIIEPAGRRVVSHGRRDRNDQRDVNRDTVFEIGSITKVFTSLLLADMVRRGTVALTDPVAKYLPSDVKMPERGGRTITLEDLARHRSGLPPMPTNLAEGGDLKDAYAGYSVKQLYEYLSGCQLPREGVAEFAYSNLGAGLLGHALALAAGDSYETLVRTRISEPLRMGSTAITLSPDLRSRLAAGHDVYLKPTASWTIPTLAGAGALHSTVTDLLSFLAVQLGYQACDLGPAITATQVDRRPAVAGMEIGLGWLMKPNKGSEIIWHNGGTNGYRAFIGFDPQARTGVVVLSNMVTPGGVDDLGFHLLDPDLPLLPPDSPLLQPPRGRTEITLDAEILDGYVGDYEFAPGVLMSITRAGGQLYARITGQPRIEVFAESERQFFFKAVDAHITFETDGQPPTRALLFRQGDQEHRATRVAR